MSAARCFPPGSWSSASVSTQGSARCLSVPGRGAPFNLQGNISSFHEEQRPYTCPHEGCGKTFAIKVWIPDHSPVVLLPDFPLYLVQISSCISGGAFEWEWSPHILITVVITWIYLIENVVVHSKAYFATVLPTIQNGKKKGKNRHSMYARICSFIWT